MKIHDISQNILQSKAYGDDTPPTATLVRDIDSGYRLTDINMCLHNATHIDAPSHFVANGNTVDNIDLGSCIGQCEVVRIDSDIDSGVIDTIANCTRVLFDGKGLIVPSGATRLVERGCKLVGIARASVANTNDSTEVHNILLSANVVILEGLVLRHITPSRYQLIALPLNFGGCEASPTRAVLIEGMTTTILQPNSRDYEQAGQLIRQGELVAFPTETVYGLGANAFDSQAVDKIFVAKGRPQDNPLIVHVCNASQIEDVVSGISDTARIIIDKLMPASITIVLPKGSKIGYNVTAGLDTVAVRMPASVEARQFIRACGVPIAAPSANTSTRPSPTRWVDVREDMDGKISAIIAGQDCEVGIESTVLDLTGTVPTILRPGIITASMISSIIGQPVRVLTNTKDKVNSPGVKYSHYAPKCPMVLNMDGDMDKVIAYYNTLVDKGYNPVILCGQPIDANYYLWGTTDKEIASNIYTALRNCEKKYDYILATYCSNSELSASIYNRLTKSSSGHIL